MEDNQLNDEQVNVADTAILTDNIHIDTDSVSYDISEMKTNIEVMNYGDAADNVLDTIVSTDLSNADCSVLGCENCVGLQKELKAEQKRCKILRENIHKVSANWFQRKNQISESDSDTEVHPVTLLSSTTRMAGEGEDEELDDNLDEDNNMDEGRPTRKGGKSGKSKNWSKLVSMIAQKSAQLDVSDSQVRDLKKRMREYEKIIDDKDDIIQGLKDQLESYLNDNQQMSLQLTNLQCLFHQLEKVDKESVAPPQVDESAEESATIPLPTQDDFQEMASSVSRTYIKLKDLIYEKKALVIEIERLNTLNVELQRRVVQQETRLISVSDALHQTWLVVSDLKDQHAKLHDDETILRYELKEKRGILTRLRKELESSRAQWQIIRQKNYESEQEYASIRAMLQERREAAETGVTDVVQTEHEESDESVTVHPDDAKSFDPPVDLLLEMGLEYGIIGEEAEMTQTVLDVIRGEDVRNSRLEQLEEHCSLLYQKLLASTSRSLSLASRLSRLHRHFGSSDDEDEDEDVGYVVVQGDGDDDDDDDEEEDLDEGDTEDEEDQEEEDIQYLTDANHMAVIESVLSSPDSEDYDTAYVSEADGADIPAEEVPANIPSTSTAVASVNEASNISLIEKATDESITEMVDNIRHASGDSGELEEGYDNLSRTLINFLPRKIEFLKNENKRMEQSLSNIKDERLQFEENCKRLEKEKNKLEEEMKILTKDMTIEKLQKRQLEEQLKHLGKCVDELKLKPQLEKSKSEKDAKKKEDGNVDQADVSEENKEQEEEEPTVHRNEEERKIEDDKMKKEVELVKKDMELKKREKELKKKEEEVCKREKEALRRETEKRNSTSTSSSPGHVTTHVTQSDHQLVHEGPSAGCSTTGTALMKTISDVVMRNLALKQGSDKNETVPQAAQQLMTENGTIIENNLSETNTTSYTISEIRLQPAVRPEDMRQEPVSIEVDVPTNYVLVIPVQMTTGAEEIICSIHPSKEATLFVLSVSRTASSETTSIRTSHTKSVNTSFTISNTEPSSSKEKVALSSSSNTCHSSSSEAKTAHCQNNTLCDTDSPINMSSSTVLSTSSDGVSNQKIRSDVSDTLSRDSELSCVSPEIVPSLLLPVSLIPAGESYVTLRAHQPTTCIIVIRNTGSTDQVISCTIKKTSN